MEVIPADIETVVFEKSRLNKAKLLTAGFQEVNGTFVVSLPFHDGQFRADLTVHEDGEVEGTVVETDLEEVYLPLRVASLTSPFVLQVRQEYMDLLEDIRAEAFDEQLFRGSQANRILSWIEGELGDSHDCPFEKYPENVVCRVPGSQKWYAIFLYVEREKLGESKAQGSVDILNLKQEEGEVEKLICESGILPAYHMNKKNWVSVVLDDTLKDERIHALIRSSRNLVSGKTTPSASGEWILPANPSMYDLNSHFRRQKEILWHQPFSASAGDTVYIYLGKPVSAIVYQTVVLEAGLPVPSSWGGRYKKAMRLKLVKRYPEELLTMNVLRTFGVRSMHGAKKVTLELKKVIDSLSEIE
ncbi:MAG: MmcQ/YjbR family DNA-binding protein [Solobacterium sp.]|nr:MmcQ/YjbR family DNA-binding protein [Solobacterium sp.]